MNIGGIPLEVSARINHCHTPIDVIFLVQSEATIFKNFNPGSDDGDGDGDNDAAGGGEGREQDIRQEVRSDQ